MQERDNFSHREGIYVHVPWCRRRCTYCDFSFQVQSAQKVHDASADFRECVREELKARRHELKGGLASLYFGGGTPSMLDSSSLKGIVSDVAKLFELPENAEVTLEVNPEDVSEDYAKALAAAGINRVSMGVQSFDDKTLEKLGRVHRGHDAKRALERLQKHVTKNISVDLIIGCEQRFCDEQKRLEHDLDAIEAFGVDHVSAYALTVEEGTPLHKLIALKKRHDIDEDAQTDALLFVRKRLQAIGLKQYEISSYARPGFESRHNRVYWSQGSYIGVGPSAHSMRLLDDGGVKRMQNTPNVKAWMSDVMGCEKESETLEPLAAFYEAIAFGLRDMGAGVSIEKFERRHRVRCPSSLLELLKKALKSGQLSGPLSHVRLTSEGALFADAIARDVLYDLHQVS